MDPQAWTGQGGDLLQQAEELWRACLPRVAARLGEAAFHTWISPLRPKAILEGTLLLAAPSDFSRTWINSHYLGTLQECVSETAGAHLQVALTTADQPPAPSPPPPAPTPKASRIPEPALNPRFTFDTFVVGPSNQFAHAAAMKVAESPAQAYNPLFIYGGAGLGKTHLLHAIGHYTRHLHPDASLVYVTTEQFTNEFIAAIRDDRIAAFQRRYRHVGVLLVDDVQFLEGKERTQEEFFHTFNTLHAAGGQIVLTSDRPPKQIATLEERLRTRFEGGLLTDIQPPDLETRVAILKKKAALDGLDLPEDVAHFIASHIPSNIREMEGALIRVAAYASLNRRPIDLPLAEACLGPILGSRAEKPLTPDEIIRETASFFALTPEDLTGPGRSRTLVLARQVAMYLCRELTDLSLPRIGRIFGGRDHTTVLHATTKLKRLMAERRSLYEQVQEITARLRAPSHPPRRDPR